MRDCGGECPRKAGVDELATSPGNDLGPTSRVKLLNPNAPLVPAQRRSLPPLLQA
jgi:hypothetical protein